MYAYGQKTRRRQVFRYIRMVVKTFRLKHVHLKFFLRDSAQRFEDIDLKQFCTYQRGTLLILVEIGEWKWIFRICTQLHYKKTFI